MTRAGQIQSAWWSPALARPGHVVEGIADVEQALTVIFSTPRGADAHRPTFGCDLDRLVDLPASIVAERIPAALIEAAELWEPRVEVLGVPVQIDGAHVTYTVLWRLKGADGADIRRLADTFPRRAGGAGPGGA